MILSVREDIGFYIIIAALVAFTGLAMLHVAFKANERIAQIALCKQLGSIAVFDVVGKMHCVKTDR